MKWWCDTKSSEEECERAGDLISETASIEEYQQSWHRLGLEYATLFSNRVLVGYNWGSSDSAAKELWPTDMVSENLIKEIGESAVSKASSSPLKPTLVPHGNSWKIERAVRILDKFQFGVWRQTKSEEAAVRAFLDSYISGVGCVHSSYDEKTKILTADPVFYDNIIVDGRECVNRQPPRTYRIRKIVPTKAIEAQYGDLIAEKKKYVSYRSVGDQWEVVVEAWRIPDSDGKGGRHVKACRGRLLADEPWKHSWVPLVFFHYHDRLSGFYWPGGVEDLVPYQLRHNELNAAIKEAQDIACRPRLLVHANTQLDLGEWDNEAGRVTKWTGSEPRPMVWPTNLQELYAERERNRQSAFSHAGQSEAFAGANLPSGVRLDSSAGVREFRNMEDSRHLRRWTRFEEFRLEIARTHLRVLSRYPSAKAYTSIYHPPRARAAAKSIAFEAVKDLTEDCYSWTMEAAPLTQQSPAARRETIREYAAQGLIDGAQAKMLLTNPNLEWQDQLEQAAHDDIARHIEIMEDGGYEAPTEITALEYGVYRVTANIHRLRNYDDVDPEVIENHHKWIVTATSIGLAMAQPAPQPVEPGMEAVPTEVQEQPAELPPELQGQI